MREYGQIQCSFWTDADHQGLSDAAILLAAYLLTGPHSNGLGCYRLPIGYIQEDRPNWSIETISKGFNELSRIGFCKRCETTKYVLIPKFLYWNPIVNPKIGIARVKEFETVPKKSSIYSDLCASLKRYGNHLPKGIANLIETGEEQERTLPDPKGTDPKAEQSESGTSAGLLARALREKGVDVAPHNPVLIAWINEGVGQDQLLACVQIIQQRDPTKKRIAAKYLDAVVRDQMNQTPSKGVLRHETSSGHRQPMSAVDRVRAANAAAAAARESIIDGEVVIGD